MDRGTDDRTPDSGQAAGAGESLSAREAAAVLGVNERTVRRAIARGALPAAKRAGVYRIAPRTCRATVRGAGSLVRPPPGAAANRPGWSRSRDGSTAPSPPRPARSPR